MKLVINTCFGGANLSHEAMNWLLQKGFTGLSSWTHDSKSIFADSFIYSGIAYGSRLAHEVRNDPLLVQVVEQLGLAASGSCSKLKVVEIPDGVKWQIEEYDGAEHVAEAHRTWG